MTDNPWRKLAAKMGPDGKPLIPGLRKPCPYATQGHVHSAEDLIVDAHLSVTTCPGWVLVNDDRAIVAAQEYILSRRWALTIERVGDKVQVIIHKGKVGFVGDSSPWLAVALAQALGRALGVKP